MRLCGIGKVPFFFPISYKVKSGRALILKIAKLSLKISYLDVNSKILKERGCGRKIKASQPINKPREVQ